MVGNNRTAHREADGGGGSVNGCPDCPIKSGQVAGGCGSEQNSGYLEVKGKQIWVRDDGAVLVMYASTIGSEESVIEGLRMKTPVKEQRRHRFLIFHQFFLPVFVCLCFFCNFLFSIICSDFFSKCSTNSHFFSLKHHITQWNDTCSATRIKGRYYMLF